MTYLRTILLAIALSLAALAPAPGQVPELFAVVEETSEKEFMRGIKAFQRRDFPAVKKAYLRGDFATALLEWGRLSERGNAAAQFNIGTMYSIGLGVAKTQAKRLAISQWLLS
jgi:TPR repeat protein